MYKRRLLLNMLKERGIVFDLETKKIIDDRTEYSDSVARTAKLS